VTFSAMVTVTLKPVAGALFFSKYAVTIIYRPFSLWAQVPFPDLRAPSSLTV
jgi:hypothetical protein